MNDQEPANDHPGDIKRKDEAHAMSGAPTALPMKSVARAEKSTATAVTYLRVSTKEQAEMGGHAEGFSIPSQRLAVERQAETIGAIIVEEFTDAGESARSADRP